MAWPWWRIGLEGKGKGGFVGRGFGGGAFLERAVVGGGREKEREMGRTLV